MDERAQRDVAEAIRRGQQMRAITPAEVVAHADELSARMPDIAARWFCGPDNGKGRQAGYVATHAEMEAWNSQH